MKILKKINKGLILTLIVVMVLVIYLVRVEEQREADKEEIVKTCEKFIELTDKYAVLPENLQTLGVTIPKSKTSSYENEMKLRLEEMMIENEEAVKIQYELLKSNLENGYNLDTIRTSQKKNITKINSYEFEGNQVTVTFEVKLEETIKYLDEENKEQEEHNSSSTAGNEITLQKVNGEWKIVYSYLYTSGFVDYTDTYVF